MISRCPILERSSGIITKNRVICSTELRHLGCLGARVQVGGVYVGQSYMHDCEWTSEYDLNYTAGMSAEPIDVVTFSDLSRNPRAVAERARRLGRLRVTHRDATDFYLTAADREEERNENLVTASRMFRAMAHTEVGSQAVASALEEVFPWTQHLSGAERADFSAELISALSDAAELIIDGNAHDVITGWRATARIKADKQQYRAALASTEGDYGPVECIT
jgi:hypothetical protein